MLELLAVSFLRKYFYALLLAAAVAAAAAGAAVKGALRENKGKRRLMAPFATVTYYFDKYFRIFIHC